MHHVRLSASVPDTCATGAKDDAIPWMIGVSVEHGGRGLGAGLLQDVMGRTAQLGIEIGCRGLLVHAESAAARSFSLHLVPEFEPSPTDDLHLVLLMKDILNTLAG